MNTPDPVSMCDECAATGVIGGLCLLHAQAEKLLNLAKTLAEQEWITPDVSPTGAYLVDEARAILRATEGSGTP